MSMLLRSVALSPLMLFITLGLAGRSMADFTCDAKYFLKHASTGAYYTINNANGGALQASGNGSLPYAATRPGARSSLCSSPRP